MIAFIIEQDKDGIFIVESPVLKGCRSYGRTVDEVLGEYSGSDRSLLDPLSQTAVVLLEWRK